MAQQVQHTNDAFPTIYKLRDDDGYLIPSHVSMGPYYWRRSSFHYREGEKQNYITGLLSKFAAKESKVEDLASYLLEKIDDKLGSGAGQRCLSTSGKIVYYEDIPPLGYQELAKILLLDGCYLVACFVNMGQVMSKMTTSSSQVVGGGVGSSTSAAVDDDPHSGLVERDAWYLLQNQIPFFVLEEICTVVTGRTKEVARTEFTKYAQTLLHNRKMYYNTQPPAPAPPGDVFHLLHLLHTLLIEPLCFKKTNQPAPSSRQDNLMEIEVTSRSRSQNPPLEVVADINTDNKVLQQDNKITGRRPPSQNNPPSSEPKTADVKTRRNPPAADGTSINKSDDVGDNMFQCLRRTFSCCFENNKGAPNRGQANDPENQRSGAAHGTSDVDVGAWHRATEYQIYGNVVFEPRKINDGGGNRRPAVEVLSVLNVAFNGRKVMVPGLHLDGHTCTLLHNLMALERYHPRLGTHVTAYCLFLSQIACTKEDVELLVRRGVIENHLGSPETVAETLSELGSSILLDISSSKRNYLKPLWHHLEKRYKSWPQNIMAWLYQNYFGWRNIAILLSVVAGLILLVAGVLSAVYQILAYKYQIFSYKHPPKP